MSFISSFDAINMLLILFFLTLRFFNEFLPRFQKLLVSILILVILLILISTESAHFSSMAERLSVMVQEVYQVTHLIVLFWISESLIILYPLINYLRKLCQNSQLAYQSILNHVKSCSKLCLSVPMMPDDSLRVTLIAFFAADFNLSTWKSDNLKLGT